MVFKYGHTIGRKAQVSGLINNTMHMYHKSRYRARKRYYEKEENKEKKRIYMRARYWAVKNNQERNRQV